MPSSPWLSLSPQAEEPLRARITQVLSLLAGEVAQQAQGDLVALILGGGYGRSQGAVVSGPRGQELYNDLDLVLVTRGRGGGWLRGLPQLAHRYEQNLGIAVDFSRPLPLKTLRQLPPRLLWHDLFDGHQVLYGDPDILWKHLPSWYGSPLSPLEATRLLLNRGAGLLWAWRVRQALELPSDADFVRRNLHKSGLACGDAWLLAQGWWPALQEKREALLVQGCAESHESVLGFPPTLMRRMLQAYRVAVRFKQTPDRVPSGVTETALRDQMHLWLETWLRLEGLRWGRSFCSAREYAAWSGLREPEQHRPLSWVGNLLQRSSKGWLSCGGLADWLPLHPRESLWRALPLLLQPSQPPRDPQLAARGAEFLRLWRRCPA